LLSNSSLFFLSEDTAKSSLSFHPFVGPSPRSLSWGSIGVPIRAFSIIDSFPRAKGRASLLLILSLGDLLIVEIGVFFFYQHPPPASLLNKDLSGPVGTTPNGTPFSPGRGDVAQLFS